jgi:uncharacterized protein YraI
MQNAIRTSGQLGHRAFSVPCISFEYTIKESSEQPEKVGGDSFREFMPMIQVLPNISKEERR